MTQVVVQDHQRSLSVGLAYQALDLQALLLIKLLVKQVLQVVVLDHLYHLQYQHLILQSLEYIQEQKQQRTEPQQTIEHGRLELLTGYHQSLVLHIN